MALVKSVLTLSTRSSYQQAKSDIGSKESLALLLQFFSQRTIEMDIECGAGERRGSSLALSSAKST